MQHSSYTQSVGRSWLKMAPPLHVLLLIHLVGATALIDVPDSYASGYSPINDYGQEEFHDPTYPAPRPHPTAPTCTVPVVQHSFGDTKGRSAPKAGYAPPSACPAPWSLVVLAFSASCAGRQYSRVAAVWLDGVELLRTTTAEPTASGVSWTVRKDVTRFSALLRSPPNGIVSVMLDNVINDTYNGVYQVSVSLEFYGAPSYLAASQPLLSQIPESYFQHADLIVPVSEAPCDKGYWFRIQNASTGLSRAVTIPSNTYRAVLEVFVSSHANDEFWYSNPPDSYIEESNHTTTRGNAAYREVVVSLDRSFAGSFLPFPVIYAGGLNPLFWQPVVALGAFNLPSYDVELTPFLGLLLDGKPHVIGISVVDGISEWLVDANLHLWLDPSSTDVSAGLGPSKTPCLSISRQYSSQVLNGTFNIRGKRSSLFTGWVNSSFGNLTTEVEGDLELRSLVEFTGDGKEKNVNMTAEQTTELRVRDNDRRVLAKQNVKANYPLWLTAQIKEQDGGATVIANLTHGLNHETQTEVGDTKRIAHVANSQDADGWMFVSNDSEVTNASTSSYQAYSYSKDGAVYEREISVEGCRILSDNITESTEDCCGGKSCNVMASPKCSSIAMI